MIGDKLLRLRKGRKPPMSREKFVREYNLKFRSGKGQTPLHAQTLFKYEKGKLEPPEEFLRNASAVLRVPVSEFLGTRKPGTRLRVALAPYPDFAMLHFALAGPSLFGTLPPSRPSPPIRPIYLNYSDCLEAVSSHAKTDTTADLSLFNLPGWLEQRSKYPDVVDLGVFVRFRGYALLCLPPSALVERDDTVVFSQIAASREFIPLDSPAKMRAALRRSLSQFGDACAVFVPRQTAMQALLIRILEESIADSPADVGQQRCIENLLRLARDSDETEASAYAKFADLLHKGGSGTTNAIYLGGLSQRLMAERDGAITFISGSDLDKFAEVLGPQAYEPMVHPDIVLLASRDAMTNAYDDIRAVVERLNEFKAIIEDKNQDFVIANWFASDAFSRCFRALQGHNDAIGPIWPPEQNPIRRMVSENLERFETLDWPPRPAAQDAR